MREEKLEELECAKLANHYHVEPSFLPIRMHHHLSLFTHDPEL